MIENAVQQRRVRWIMSLSVAAGAAVVQLSLMLYSPYGESLYIFRIVPVACLIFLVLSVIGPIGKGSREGLSLRLPLVTFLAVSGALLINRDTRRYIFLIVPVACLTCLVLLAIGAVRKGSRQDLSLLLPLVTLLAVSAVLLINRDAIRSSLRWLLWSHRFKAEVLAQPAPTSQQLRHTEWEVTGFAGMATKTYLVFDPADSLSAAAKSHSPGKFSGIPCEVPLVRRLEADWYLVGFYTDEAWGQRYRMNCTGFGQ